MSDAIVAGLYHPNCKDSHTTYFEGISTPPSDNKYAADELDDVAENYKAEQKKSYTENQAEKYDRLAKYSLDESNQQKYEQKATEWHEKAESLPRNETTQEEQNTPEISESQYKELMELKEKIIEEAKDMQNSGNSIHKIEEPDNKVFDGAKAQEVQQEKTVAKSDESDIIKYTYSSKVKDDVKQAFDTEFKVMTNKFGDISTVNRVEPLFDGNGEYGAFYDHSGILSIKSADKKDCLRLHAQKSIEMKQAGKWSSSHPMHTLRHEIGHAIQAEHAKNDPLWKDKIEKVSEIMKSLPEFEDLNFKGKYSVSKYAMEDLDEFISECIAESMTSKARGTAKKVANIILGAD